MSSKSCASLNEGLTSTAYFKYEPEDWNERNSQGVELEVIKKNGEEHSYQEAESGPDQGTHPIPREEGFHHVCPTGFHKFYGSVMLCMLPFLSESD